MACQQTLALFMHINEERCFIIQSNNMLINDTELFGKSLNVCEILTDHINKLFTIYHCMNDKLYLDNLTIFQMNELSLTK